jgi:hypothetical protein
MKYITPPLVAKYLSQHFARIADPQISRRELSEINQPKNTKGYLIHTQIHCEK